MSAPVVTEEWRATYRLQLEPAFPLAAAAATVPYLASVGVSHLYCSPIFEAVEGSRHGYDVTDPTRVRAALGGAAALAGLVETLRRHRMGLVLDLVPNHMAITGNPWWDDMLTDGARSPRARYFDLGDRALGEQRLLLPTLGTPYGEALLGGHLRLGAHENRLVATVDGQRVPLNPSSQAWALDVWRDHAPAGRADDLDAAASFLNADPWRVHAVLEQQHYRLAWWRLARDESPYRRFFDINGLVGVRVEDPAVFDAVHTLVGELVRDGSVDGLRVDHVDGLADPDTYLARLAALAPGTPILVEKILTADEPLPAWPVAGTTGYEAAAAIVRLFIQGRAERPVTGFYRAFTRQAEPWPEVVRAARTTVLNDQLGGDAWHVAALFAEACRHDVHLRDFSHKDCDALVRAIVTEMPTYRTYVRPGHVSPDDHARLDVVFREVRQRYGLPPALVDAAEAAMRDVAEPFAQFVRRLQQLSTAVVAKGDEDTALYRDARLLALNEVGADPSRFSMAVGEFHRTVARWQRDLPFGLRSTSTHDTKRGEDVRVRLTVLTERWPSWVAHVKVWSRRAPRGDAAIDRALEYLPVPDPRRGLAADPPTDMRTCREGGPGSQAPYQLDGA